MTREMDEVVPSRAFSFSFCSFNAILTLKILVVLSMHSKMCFDGGCVPFRYSKLARGEGKYQLCKQDQILKTKTKITRPRPPEVNKGLRGFNF